MGTLTISFTDDDLFIFEYFDITYKEIAELMKELFREHPSEADRFYILQKIIIMIKAKNLSRNPIIYETADVFRRIIDEAREGRITNMPAEKRYISYRLNKMLIGGETHISERVKWAKLYGILNHIYFALEKKKREESPKLVSEKR